MRSGLKTSLAVMAAFLVSFSILFFSIDFVTSDNTNKVQLTVEQKQKKFTEDFSKSNPTILLIGSSHVLHLNETHVAEIISKSGLNYDVYNLAMGNDSPEKRLSIIDDVKKLNPELVVYGIGFRDFTESLKKTDLTKPSSSLPDISNLFTAGFEIIKKNTNYNFESINSPQRVTINFIKETAGIDQTKETKLDRPYAPFSHSTFSHTKVMNEVELKRSMINLPTKLDEISNFEQNEKANSLLQIIQELQENRIPIIIFTTPHDRYYLDTISDNDKSKFLEILNLISEKRDVSIYFLHEKYADMKIWNSNAHVAIGSHKIIPNSDLAEIIIQELEK